MFPETQTSGWIVWLQAEGAATTTTETAAVDLAGATSSARAGAPIATVVSATAAAAASAADRLGGGGTRQRDIRGTPGTEGDYWDAIDVWRAVLERCHSGG
jgi:hypothetical protein